MVTNLKRLFRPYLPAFHLRRKFACASAIQEMLLQSHTGVIKVFPAIPESWQNASFRNMRAMGAFLITASYKDGKVEYIKVQSEKEES